MTSHLDWAEVGENPPSNKLLTNVQAKNRSMTQLPAGALVASALVNQIVLEANALIPCRLKVTQPNEGYR